MKPYKKYYNLNGQVAVLYSPGYGAGWYTWSNDEGMLYDDKIVAAVLNNDFITAAKIAEEKYDAYAGGANDLKIYWMKPGTIFKINEYDGHESIEILNRKMLIA